MKIPSNFRPFLLKLGSVTSLCLVLCSCANFEGRAYKIKACFSELNQVPLNNYNSKYALFGEFKDIRSEEGQNRLRESVQYNDYPNLAAAHLTQSTQTFCGIASSAMVLNADDASLEWRPQTTPYKPFHFYTQCNILNKNVYEHMSIKTILSEGMQLNEIHYVLTQQPSVKDVSCSHASDVILDAEPANTNVMPDSCGVEESIDSFTHKVKNALKSPGTYVIANFSEMPNLDRGGHFSPIAAYHEATDSFLIMEVSRYKFPPFWVTRKTLWEKMNTVDAGSGKARGYIIVETKTDRPVTSL